MTFTTGVVWGREPTPTEQTNLQTEADVYVLEGKTDGVLGNVTIESVVYSTRTWIDNTSAETWVGYVNTYTPPPTNAVILES